MDLFFNDPLYNSGELAFNDPFYVLPVGHSITSVNGGSPVTMGVAFDVEVTGLVGNPSFEATVTRGATVYTKSLSHTGTGPYTVTLPDVTLEVEDSVEDIPATTSGWTIAIVVTDDNDDSTASSDITVNLASGLSKVELFGVTVDSGIGESDIATLPANYSQAWWPTATGRDITADGQIVADDTNSDFTFWVWHSATGLTEVGTALFENSNTATVTSPVRLSIGIGI